MGDEKELVVIEQKQVDFYEDALTAVRGADNQIYVAVTQMCRALGLNERSQRRRIQNHTILSEGYIRGDISTPPSPGGRGGGIQRAGLIRVDLVPLWLAGIEAGKASDNMRPKLERFQREAAKVLWEAFQEGQLTADPSFEELLQSDSDAVQAYKILQAMVKLARTQVLIESRLDQHDVEIAEQRERLEQVEATLGDPGRHITPDQASQISQAVKAIAMALGERSGRNEYGGVYGELYRRFGITSYKLLPAAKFEEAMAWLGEWYQTLTGEAPF